MTNGISKKQAAETVEQAMRDVNVRLATVTCPCGWKRGLTKMYKCLYCDVWFCEFCAEVHFGKTRKAYKAGKHYSSLVNGIGLGVVLAIACLIGMQACNADRGLRLEKEVAAFESGTDWRGRK